MQATRRKCRRLVPQASRLRVLGASRPESVRPARRRPNSQARTPERPRSRPARSTEIHKGTLAPCCAVAAPRSTHLGGCGGPSNASWRDESEPQSPSPIWQRNGGKGMKTKSLPVPIPLPPFLCPKSRCPIPVRPSAPGRSLPTSLRSPPKYADLTLRSFGARVLLTSPPSIAARGALRTDAPYQRQPPHRNVTGFPRLIDW